MFDPHHLIPVAVVTLVAVLCGLVLARLKQPAIVGYIFAGVVLGPSGLGLVEDVDGVGLLAEMGVLLLLFVIGMELSLRAFRHLWKIAMATMALQVAGAVGAMWVVGEVMGWPLAAVLLLGFVVALSSTAVAIKILEDIGELRTRTGRITVSVLIAQDLAVVPMILVLDVAAIGEFDAGAVGRIVLSVGLLIALILFLSRRQRVNLPIPEYLASHPDIAPLAGLVACLGAATVAGLVGLSPAYGAFLAGLTIGNSNLRGALLEPTLPIQSVLLMVFFLSVGLLIDLHLVWENIELVAFLLLVVTVLKTVVNVTILRVLRQSWGMALLSGLVLAQVGEFSFLLGGLAVQREVISGDEFRIIVTVAALSLAVSAAWLAAVRRLTRVAGRRVSARRVFRVAFGPLGGAVVGAFGRLAPRRRRTARAAPVAGDG
ncbi:MAG: cation:proton antiporter [Alphaproteobacteria bacterium]